MVSFEWSKVKKHINNQIFHDFEPEQVTEKKMVGRDAYKMSLRVVYKFWQNLFFVAQFENLWRYNSMHWRN